MTELVDYDSPAALKAFLEEKGLAMQKKFGQNFLVNAAARKKLIDALDIDSNSTVWEIGPGLGAMTAEILSRGASVNVFEIDFGFAAILKDFFGADKHFSIVEGDVLKTWKPYKEKNGVPDRLFGNLPYNIAATVFADFICANVRFDEAVITVQKEVAMRMLAKPGSDDYSSFSVLCQWAYNVSPVMDLAGGSFWPRPNVDSRAVKFVKKEQWPQCTNPFLFTRMQRALFASRRKTVKNNLALFFNNPEKAVAVLAAAGIDPRLRAETLTIEELLHLSDIADSYQE